MTTIISTRTPTARSVDRPDHDYERLFRRHLGLALAYARQFTRNHADAEDITSEAFGRVFNLMNRGLGPSAEGFATYLRHAVRSCAVEHIRRHEKEYLADNGTFADLMAAPDALGSFVDQGSVVLREDLLVRAFNSLSPSHRLVLLLTAIEGLHPAVAALALNKTPGQVHSLAYRARNKLRSRYRCLAASPSAATQEH